MVHFYHTPGDTLSIEAGGLKAIKTEILKKNSL
jgi:hypothetical protein